MKLKLFLDENSRIVSYASFNNDPEEINYTGSNIDSFAILLDTELIDKLVDKNYIYDYATVTNIDNITATEITYTNRIPKQSDTELTVEQRLKLQEENNAILYAEILRLKNII